MTWYTSQVIVDICSSAMIKLGAEPISDLLDNTKEARLSKIQFPRIRDAVLRSAPWSFALKRVSLLPAVLTPAFGDPNFFLLPNDCVKFVKCNDRYLVYSIEGKHLVSDAEAIEGWYVSRDIEPEFYDPNFSETVACMLAADLCYSITQSTTLKQGLEVTAKLWIDEARSYNSQEITPDDFRFDEFIEARRGGRAVYDDSIFI